MAHKVLITAPYFQLVIDDFKDFFAQNDIEIVVPKVSERMSEEELIPLIADVHGILCGDDKITEKVLDAAKNLKVIVKWGTGIDSIDKVSAEKRGVPVKNTPNAFTTPVADTILSMMLCFARGTIELDREMKDGKWEKRLYTTLSECTVGVVGLGNIGQAVVKRLKAFDAKVLGNDIVEKPFDFMVSLEELLRESDFVVLATDLNPRSHHLINERTLALMKPTSYLINASRGPIVDEEALIEALKSKRIAGAGLDVFEDEPLANDHPFKKMKNVILSPHNANASKMAWDNVHKNSLKSLLEGLNK